MSRIEYLTLQDADSAEAWLRMLAAQARSKKLVDTDDEKLITDLFLASVLESMNFKDIQKVIMSHLQPTKRLVVAERSNFYGNTSK